MVEVVERAIMAVVAAAMEAAELAAILIAAVEAELAEEDEERKKNGERPHPEASVIYHDRGGRQRGKGNGKCKKQVRVKNPQGRRGRRVAMNWR